jgi:hypothetical protein
VRTLSPFSRLASRKQLAVMTVLLVTLSIRGYRWRSNEIKAVSQPGDVEHRPSPIANEDPMLPKRRDPPRAALGLSQGGSNEVLAAREKAETQTRTRSDGASDWGIIAATYNAFNPAAKRARSLRSQFPDCSCSVFPREGEGLKYYVLVGSGMTSEVAEALRNRAVAAGLPHHAYVTKIAVRPGDPQ